MAGNKLPTAQTQCVVSAVLRAVEGDHQDSHQDLVSQQVAVQDQLDCLPQLQMGLPWGCPISQALGCPHPALEQATGMRMVSASCPLAHGPKQGSCSLPAPVLSSALQPSL